MNKVKSLPIVISKSPSLLTGYLKFYDESKLYGFLVLDQDQSDIFVHFDDLKIAGVTKEIIL